MDLFRKADLCRLKRREDYNPYWGTGADDRPLPYMDGIEFIHGGDGINAHVSALQNGTVDIVSGLSVNSMKLYNAVKNDSRIALKKVASAGAHILRMRVDLRPWNDNRVRTALKLCQHREKLWSLVDSSQGLLGQDFHVCPIHPEYCEKPTPAYDPEKSRSLLKEAGYGDGIHVDMTVTEDVARHADILKLDAARGGFHINVTSISKKRHMNEWKDPPLGITHWFGRPLGTIALNLGYAGDKQGMPVPWNETRWTDGEFDRHLKIANGTIDVEKRRRIFCKLERIQMERGSIGIAWWENSLMAMLKRVRDAEAHPTGHMLFNRVWLFR